MKARGKCDAKRSTSPLVNHQKARRGLKGRNNSSRHLFRPFRPRPRFCGTYPGATRFALAPGFHIPRLRRCWAKPRQLKRLRTHPLPQVVLTVSKAILKSCGKRSINSNPLHTRGKEFLFRIDRDDIRAQSTDTTIRTKRDFGYQ